MRLGAKHHIFGVKISLIPGMDQCTTRMHEQTLYA